MHAVSSRSVVPHTIPAPDPLEVTAINEHSWRVCDSRRPESDAMRLLAFIERRRTSYRITWLAGGRGWAVFEDFNTALRSVKIRCMDQGLD